MLCIRTNSKVRLAYAVRIVGTGTSGTILSVRWLNSLQNCNVTAFFCCAYEMKRMLQIIWTVQWNTCAIFRPRGPRAWPIRGPGLALAAGMIKRTTAFTWIGLMMIVRTNISKVLHSLKRRDVYFDAVCCKLQKFTHSCQQTAMRRLRVPSDTQGVDFHLKTFRHPWFSNQWVKRLCSLVCVPFCIAAKPVERTLNVVYQTGACLDWKIFLGVR